MLSWMLGVHKIADHVVDMQDAAAQRLGEHGLAYESTGEKNEMQVRMWNAN